MDKILINYVTQEINSVRASGQNVVLGSACFNYLFLKTTLCQCWFAKRLVQFGDVTV